jgi:thioester reductase-like protein
MRYVVTGAAGFIGSHLAATQRPTSTFQASLPVFVLIAMKRPEFVEK